MGKGDDPWLESLDEFKQLQRYEKQKEEAKNALIKSERTVRGDWKPRQKVCPKIFLRQIYFFDNFIFSNFFGVAKYQFTGDIKVGTLFAIFRWIVRDETVRVGTINNRFSQISNDQYTSFRVKAFLLHKIFW